MISYTVTTTKQSPQILTCYLLLLMLVTLLLIYHHYCFRPNILKKSVNKNYKIWFTSH